MVVAEVSIPDLGSDGDARDLGGGAAEANEQKPDEHPGVGQLPSHVSIWARGQRGGVRTAAVLSVGVGMASRAKKTLAKAPAKRQRRAVVETASPTATLQAGLGKRLETLHTELTRTDELSKGRVHRLRVATRRLLAALELAGVAAPPPATKRMQKLEKLLGGLSKLRDLDVLLDGATTLAGQHAELGAALEPLAERREQLARRASRRIERFAIDELTNDVSTVLDALEQLKRLGDDAALRAAVLGRLAARYLEAERLRAASRAEDRKALHRLRVALKSYRYATEVLAPSLGAHAQRDIEVLKGLQDRLGALRDQETLASLVLSRAKRRHAGPELAGVGEGLLAEQQRAASECVSVLEAGATRWPF